MMGMIRCTSRWVPYDVMEMTKAPLPAGAFPSEVPPLPSDGTTASDPSATSGLELAVVPHPGEQSATLFNHAVRLSLSKRSV
jgi:hypothetical protein